MPTRDHPVAAQSQSDPLAASAEAVQRSEVAQRWAAGRRWVGGVPFVAVDPADVARDLVRMALRADRAHGDHVHLANAFSIACADSDDRLAAVAFLPSNGWNLCDGRPVTWISARRRHDPAIRQVRGPQLMLDVIGAGLRDGLTHYLLGGSPETLQALEANLRRDFPGVRIVGADSPPFTTATEEDLRVRDERIAASGAQVVWVGLGTPKQDLEAARIARGLPVVAIAIGAAFDFNAGRLRRAPRWISFVGMEWLWRLAMEPRRLWRRYTIGNLRFLRAVRREGRALRRDARRG